MTIEEENSMPKTVLFFSEAENDHAAVRCSIRGQLSDTDLVCVSSPIDALRQCDVLSPDYLVACLTRLNDSDLRLLQSLHHNRSCPVITFISEASPEGIKSLINLDVSVLIQGDFDAARLRTLFSIASARFEAQQKLYGELEDARTRLADRKLLDRAKGLLMSQGQMAEAEAYALLRKQAMDKGLRLGVVARQVIDTFELLHNDTLRASSMDQVNEARVNRMRSA